MKVFYVDIKKIKGNPYQTRLIIQKEPLQTLISSIRERGLFNPITLLESDDGYIVVHGHRRLEAFKKLRRKTIPAFVKPRSQKDSLITDLIHENLLREDLSVQEKALSIKLLLSQIKNLDDVDSMLSCIHAVHMYKGRGPTEFRRKATKHNDDDMFMCMKLLKTIGMSENNAISYLTLLKLPIEIQKRVVFNITAKDEKSSKYISIRTANLLARVKDSEFQKTLLERALGGTTARHIEGLVNNHIDKVNKGEWKGFVNDKSRVNHKLLNEDCILELAMKCENLSKKINSFKLSRIHPLSETMDQMVFESSAKQLQKELRLLSECLDRIFKNKGWKCVIEKNKVFELQIHQQKEKKTCRGSIPIKMLRDLNIKPGDFIQAKVLGVKNNEN